MGVSADHLADELKAVPAFSGLGDNVLQWLAAHMTVVETEADEIVAREGDPADSMTVILRGSIRGQAENGESDGSVYTAEAGQVTGMLPYSRLTEYPLTTRTSEPSRIAKLPASHFPEMLQRFPELGRRLVAVLADRVRATTKADEQRDKLVSLGRLSAGLAHEMNNPAAAARRAAQSLRDAVYSLRSANLRLGKRSLTNAQRVMLAHVECDWTERGAPVVLDSMEHSDREEEIGTWLEERSIPNAWELASGLVDAGVELPTLERLATEFEPDVLGDVITRLTASFTVSRLVEEIDSSTARIVELVRAVKEYSHMDRAPQQEVDIHEGLESTLVMLRFRLKQNINVIREYDRSASKICAYGSELNQVWTNLIENAVDAMKGQGELRIRTSAGHGRVVVEIRDNGPGIPADIKDRIFDPFFTTKPVGEGTGLGLDTVFRIVRKHRGEISVESEPGCTCFRVALPFANGKGEGK